MCRRLRNVQVLLHVRAYGDFWRWHTCGGRTVKVGVRARTTFYVWSTVSVGCEPDPPTSARTRTRTKINVRPHPLVKVIRQREREREREGKRITNTNAIPYMHQHKHQRKHKKSRYKQKWGREEGRGPHMWVLWVLFVSAWHHTTSLCTHLMIVPSRLVRSSVVSVLIRFITDDVRVGGSSPLEKTCTQALKHILFSQFVLCVWLTYLANQLCLKRAKSRETRKFPSGQLELNSFIR